MNQKEFLEYLSQHLPPTLGKVTPEDLKRWEDFRILPPHPEYHKGDIHVVMGLMKMEQDLQKQASTQGIEQEKPVLPLPTSGIIYQILSILGEAASEEEMKEKAIVRRALGHTGLISTLGFVFFNFSPLTGTTLEGLWSEPLKLDTLG